ncbi:MAG: hypothetical protein EAZ74_03605 [Alphaproteobacteria bacterium]|nr:MAG: hypothetical protein EAZ74_03605 [Alphaproteobacteria bacterium]TAF74808.1 MAG: hypothetical protein EAZ52_08075 [Alphaproteobacteria bacterium]
MKHKLFTSMSALIFALATPAYSEPSIHAGHDMAGMSHNAHEEAKTQNSVKLELNPASTLTAGKTTQVTLKMTNMANGKPLTLDDLKEAHTKKLHLLIVDPSLTDYHHIHPVAGRSAGEFVFDFTPKKNDSYRVWADVIPVATGSQEYVMADMGNAVTDKAAIIKTIIMTSMVDGYTFTLALDSEPKAGSAVMGNITVTKDGKPFTQLEPVMGAFAHVVGFTEDYNSVMHIHPMGKEPTGGTERDGPKLEFHIEPKKAGFVKMFAQVKIGGKDIFAPFAIMVK